MVLWWKVERSDMAVKKFNQITMKVITFQSTDKAPERSIDEIKKGIEALGCKVEITGTKLTNDVA